VTAILAGPMLEMAVLIAKEFLFGILLGGLLAIPFWGIQSAGDLIDSNRGASATNQSDPVNANEQSQLGFIFNFAALAVFVVMGGVQVVILLIYESYAVVRVGRFLPDPGPEVAATLGMLLNKMLLIGIVAGGPLLIVLFVVDVVLAIAARVAKQIPVNDFSGIVKNLVTAAFIPLYSIFLSQYMVKDWSSIMLVVRDFIGIKLSG
jgi:type III secretion protein T